MKEPFFYLVHMNEAMEKIANYIKDGEADFQNEAIIQDAVIRNLEIIGEAAKRIPESVRNESHSIPWKRLAGLRDILIHQYEGVDLGQVWRIVDMDLPEIREHIRKLMDKYPPQSL
jgi:uncharacterized protein with HEPN domain